MTPAEKEKWVATRDLSPWKRRFRIFWAGWDTRICVCFVTVLLIVALLPSQLWPESACRVNLVLRHQPPWIAGGSSAHLLGTDHLGRNILYRLFRSTRLTLLIAGLATLVSTLTGTTAGLISGYFRGKADVIVMQLVDTLLAFPSLLLVLALVAAVGRTLTGLVVVLGITGWAQYTRVIRSVTLSLSGVEFVEAAKAVGGKPFYILVRHLLPNIVSPIVVLSTLGISQVILTESVISFLGLGPAPPDITWGGMIGEGRNYLYSAWWSAFFPGSFIFMSVLCFNYLGDVVREAFDPFTTRHVSRS